MEREEQESRRENFAKQVERWTSLARKASVEDESLDVRGIAWLEHINIVVGCRDLAEVFYFQGLGLTRDPAKDVGPTMWANIGPRQQLHLVNATEASGAQTLCGHIGLALPDLDALRKRLKSVANALKGTQFSVDDHGDFVAVSCPWGNKFCIFSSQSIPALPQAERPAKIRRTRMAEAHDSVDLGMAVRGEPGIRFLRLECRNARGVGNFYKDVFDCCVHHDGDDDCAVCVGPSVHLLFDSRAPAALTPERTELSRGIHICVYICEFKRTYEALQKKGLIWTNPRFASLDTCDSFEEASAGRQYRFRSLRDKGTEKELVELEHETRSLRHLQFMKEVYYVSK